MDPKVAPSHADRTDPLSISSEGEGPGLPGLRTWRAVYLFVLTTFVVLVVLFALFSWYFS